MTECDIRKRLTTVFRKVYDDESLEIADEMTDWDSITYLNIITSTEKAFDIRFVTKEIHRMTSVARMVDVIVSKLGSGPALESSAGNSEYRTPEPPES